MPSLHHHNPASFFFDAAALYCEEEHWDNVEQQPTYNYNSLNLIGGENTNRTGRDPLVGILGQDLFGEGEELSFLLNKETESELYTVFEGNTDLIEARAEAVEWILKIVGYYSFSALTAILAVDYLNRFLHSFQTRLEKPWMAQLAAVACLSLAAKVEETQVPLLLDLQVEESQYMFDSKTIQRMELLILSTLKWKMNPVTPLSFLEYIARELSLERHFCGEFLRRSQCLLLSVVSDWRFMSYLPSALATATMLYVISSLEPSIGMEHQDKLAGILGINKGKVEECCKLIQEVMANATRKRKLGAMPGSPKGALDVCFSFTSDSSNESWAVSSTTASVSSSPEPLAKKLKKPQSPTGDANI